MKTKNFKVVMVDGEHGTAYIVNFSELIESLDLNNPDCESGAQDIYEIDQLQVGQTHDMGESAFGVIFECLILRVS